MLANFTPGHQDAYVDFANDERAPLLLIAGGEDHLEPPAIQESLLKHYRTSSARTDFQLFEGRAHYTIGQEGWEKLADYALDWSREHASVAARAG